MKNSSLKVGTKISLGFGVVLILLTGISIIGYNSLSGANDQFNEYRSYARQTNQMGRIQANLLYARFHAKNYIINNNEESAIKVKKRIQTTVDLIKESDSLFTRKEALDVIASAYKGITDYQMYFDKVVDYVKVRNASVERMNNLGPQIQRLLTSIMESSRNNSKHEEVYLAGMALRSLMLARLYSNKFLIDNDAASSKRALSELDIVGKLEKQLLSIIDRDEAKHRLEEAIIRINDYKEVFKNVVDTINARNAIIQGQLDVIGPNIGNSVEELKLENKKFQDTIGPQTTEDMQSAVSMTLVASIISVILGIALAYVIGRGISRPIIGMTRTMKDLADDKLDIQVPSTERRDEIGDMAQAVEIFKNNAIEVKKLTEDQKRLEEEAKIDRQRAMNSLAEKFQASIGGMIQNLMGSTEDMKISAEQMKKLSEDGIQSCLTAAVASEESSSNVTSVSGAMEEMNISNNDISSQILMVNSKTSETTDDAQKTREFVDHLKESVDNIGEVIVAIEDIAEQTHVLALNATIEAARAGEAGKGFAVVAKEVKELASGTSEKTNLINSRISEIKSATTNTVDAMNRIINNISDVNEAVMSVSTAVEQQNLTTNEINKSLTEVSSGTQEVSKIVGQLKESATMTDTSAEKVNGAAENLAFLAEDVTKSVNDFILNIKAS